MIYRLGGRFNINSLQSSLNIPRFASLLQTVSPKLGRSVALSIAQSVSQFMLS